MSRQVLITGCSSGIGKALAQVFAARGDRVIATARNPQSLAELADSGCITLALDVNAADSHDALAEALHQAGIMQLDVLIHNAGISAMGPLLELPADKLRGQFETNVFAPVLLTQKLFPWLQASPAAVIVNMGSVSGVLTTPFAGAYCASKAALHCLSDALRMELSPFGVKVVTVQPGAIRSNFGEAAAASINDWLSERSRYWPIRDGIMARAGASQVKATKATDFAEQVYVALKRTDPPALVRIGHGSRLFPAMARYLPAKRLHVVLGRRFGLDRLANAKN